MFSVNTRMRLDEPGSLLETGTAVSPQTAPALLGTALLRKKEKKKKTFLFASFHFALSLLSTLHKPEQQPLW